MKVKSRKKSSNNKNSKIISILLGVLAVLVVGAVVVVVLLGVNLKTDPDNPYKSIMDNPQNSPTEIDEPVDNTDKTTIPVSKTVEYNGRLYEKNEAIVNLLFLGIDSNAERKQQNMGYRSDMMMVCAVDTETKTATLISIPRDTKTSMYKVDSSGKITATVQNKINAAYSFAGNNFRATNAMTCVQMFLQRQCELDEPLDFALDIPVYFFASIDMDGIVPVATAVGGVEVTLDTTIPDVGRKGQTLVLKDIRAETYLRDRHNSSGGDIGRAAHQQTFMLALAKKIKGMGEANVIFTLHDELERYVKTNLSLDNMLDFAKLLKQVDVDAIRQITIPGKSEGRAPHYFIHDEKETLELLLDVYYKEVQ